MLYHPIMNREEPYMQVKTIPITLENFKMLNSTVRHFSFRSPAVFNYLAGQFITMHFEHQGKTLRRSYSIANVPTNDNCIEFAANYVAGGPGTNILFNLKPGDQIQVNGPFGRLILKDPIPKRYILIATGTGVTPYRAMREVLQQRLDEQLDMHVVLLLGVQTCADILYEAEFLAWANESPRFQFNAYVSREPDSTDLAQHQKFGRVNLAYDQLDLQPTDDLIYLCGNPAMIDDSFEYFKQHGFSTQQIIREKYISA